MGINGNNHKEDGVSNIYVSNHSCLKDGFYVPMALDHEIVVVVSSRVIYKNIESRKKAFNEYLYTMPMEAHGGKKYSSLCLEYITELVKNSIDISIFPEGAYVEDNVIYKGRTEATRILFDALSENEKSKINFIPVAIGVNKENKDLDSYSFDNDNVTDQALKNIAEELDKQYVDSYIELFPKGNVIFSDGNVVLTEDAQDSYYVNLYEQELKNRYTDIARQFVKRK